MFWSQRWAMAAVAVFGLDGRVAANPLVVESPLLAPAKQQQQFRLSPRIATRLAASEPVVETTKSTAWLQPETLMGQLAQHTPSPKADGLSRFACGEEWRDPQPTDAIESLAKTLASQDETAAARQQAAQLLGRIDRPDAHRALVAALRTAPTSLALAIAAALAPRAQSAELLLAEIEAGRAPAQLLIDKEVISRLRLSKLPELDQRVEELTADLPADDQRLSKLIVARRQGFSAGRPQAERGREVFAKSVCANCHRVGELGKNLGPSLDGIGVRGLDRLLEDILDPNRTVDQAFRTVMVSTADGQLFSGFGVHEEGDNLILYDNQGQPRGLPQDEVVDRLVSTMSPMPAGAIEQIPERDFYDLLAFLLSQRQVKAK